MCERNRLATEVSGKYRTQRVLAGACHPAAVLMRWQFFKATAGDSSLQGHAQAIRQHVYVSEVRVASDAHTERSGPEAPRSAGILTLIKLLLLPEIICCIKAGTANSAEKCRKAFAMESRDVK